MDFESMFENVKLNESEKSIWEYIITHLEDIPKLSSRELARLTYTHPTTILRLSKKLGFDGFNDLKVNLLFKLKTMEAGDSTIKKKDDLLTVNSNIASLYTNVINETRKNMDLSLMADLYRIIERSKYIDFIATEENAAIANWVAQLFFRQGKICHVYTEDTQQLLLGKYADKDHVVILISKTDLNSRIVETAKELRKRHISTIAITSSKDTLLAKNSDIVLLGLFKMEVAELGNVMFSISVNYLLLTLYGLLLSEHYDDIIAIQENYLKSFYNDPF